MSALQSVLTHIRETRASEVVNDVSDDRLIYACFSADLKAAMKTAARRWNWDRETWRDQTNLIQAARLAGWDDADLATAYRQPPPMVEGVA